MGEAKRRKADIDAMQGQIKLTPRQRARPLMVVHVDRKTHQDATGMVYAVNVFQVVGVKVNLRTGELEIIDQMVEETPLGPQPVFLVSLKQPIERSVIVTPGAQIAKA